METMMTRKTALSGLIAIAITAAMATAALAANSGPGSTPGTTPPPRPGKFVTPPPPPPPPGGPDKLTTQTGPLRPGLRPSTGPKPLDEFAAKPRVQKYPPLFDPCNNSDCNIESYVTDCTVMGGGASTEPGGGIVCNQGPQHQPKP
jgi:hypothetical protein